MFDWEDLRYFSTFAQTGSLASAAKKLGVDHATVARRIASLEASVNLRLVDRRPRAYVLTEDGRQIAHYGEQMNASAYSLERYSSAEQSAVEGDVVVAAPPAFIASFIAPCIGSLRKDYPYLRLTLQVTKERLSLARREADITISMVRPVESAVRTQRIGQVRFTLYGSAEYLASSGERNVIAYDDSVTETPQQAWLKEQCTEQKVVFFSNDLRIQAVAAAGHAGIALLPDYLAKEYNLVPAEPDGPALIQDVWLSVHEDVRYARRISTVLEFLKDCIEPACGL
ncbi:LysR family transcriptional regulator [Pantoea piersonii]|jgi:DNA-binding transcriptional LysR family regulator|uniref:LysR family transcriptional regulator n=1 Tax=Pantoea piersonii TaxID=2364647 RepID=UPI000EA373CD|nr:LysR family transcriptional regulator [Pantoea piersonii]MBZ6388692.1 LysR family transcriptional regulator [Pantoea piersonii]MBZ6402476.1 LysR family transcriptional regulator [Pantoea piersonii]MBZ6410671.1 LysR family transcriptional regulator [Pantoea piersonii]MBZ6429307.1 LysR family transcriptional regulator [Pantoea piersonii]NYB04625.1 LysR family transcriptional regulator [Pantoea piersonii]